MNKPLFTDRTKLYIGGYRFYEADTYTLAVTIDNTDKHLGHNPWPFIATNGKIIDNYSSILKPISGPLTLSKLADVIRSTKVDGYTYFLLAAALPILLDRLNKRLQEVRAKGKAQRLEYTAYVSAQTAIDKAQSTDIRVNNKRFKGIPY